jgi:hypothetical protein
MYPKQAPRHRGRFHRYERGSDAKRRKQETRSVKSEAHGNQMTGAHNRNTVSMLASPRCGANTRAGGSCRPPSVYGKKRCRMHGGAAGSGAPRGNKNALKHGRYTRELNTERKQIRELVRQTRKLMLQIE